MLLMLSRKVQPSVMFVH